MADLIGGRPSCDARLFGFLLGAAQHVHSIRPQPHQDREQQKRRGDPQCCLDIHRVHELEAGYRSGFPKRPRPVYPRLAFPCSCMTAAPKTCRDIQVTRPQCRGGELASRAGCSPARHSRWHQHGTSLYHHHGEANVRGGHPSQRSSVDCGRQAGASAASGPCSLSEICPIQSVPKHASSATQ